MKKCGYVSIVGKPNAGKSTLMNRILKWDLSIVNRKAQTTRNKILGILTEENYQIIFLDTPGILEPKYELQKYMSREIISSFEEADIILMVIDVTKFNLEEQKKTEASIAKYLEGKQKICILNKIDLTEQINVLPLIKSITEELSYGHIIPVSAENEFNLEEVKKVIVKLLPENDFYYDEETETDKPEKFFVSEIIRKKILESFHEEIPYSTFVEIAEFKERGKGKLFINAEITVERESQKAIIIGKRGESLKKLGERARKEIEKFLQQEIFLKLFVKIRRDWRKDSHFLKNKF